MGDDFKLIVPQDPHQIGILSRTVDLIMDLKQENTDGVTRRKSFVALKLSGASQKAETDLIVYKPKYVTIRLSKGLEKDVY